jgi:molybdopterin molybdotransferase
MLTVNEAQEIILDLIKPIQETEIVKLDQSLNRILALPITSKLDFPHWDNSSMDGYAVKFSDLQNLPVNLEIIGEIPAGKNPDFTIQKGQTARIFTGSIIPNGADTIIMQENTHKKDNIVTILEGNYSLNDFIRKKGEFYQAGNILLPQGIKITAPEIGVLAAAQCNDITVYRRPKVMILSTGNELITPDQTLKKGQIVDSNSYVLTAFLSQNGAIPLNLGSIPDEPEKLKKAIKQAISQADLVLSTGGVSVGDYDYVERILEELGGEIPIHRVKIKPGKPLTVAKFSLNSCVYFGIPGNPVSALVTCWRFIQPALKKISGLKDNYSPKFVRAITLNDLKSMGDRETYLWGNIQLKNGTYQFNIPEGGHNSGNLINLALTNSLGVIPEGIKQIRIGEQIQVMLIDD